MNKYALLFCWVTPFCLRGQVLDTAKIRREVDSLVQVCRSLDKEGKFKEGLEVIEYAEKISEKAFSKNSLPYGSCRFTHAYILHSMRRYHEAEELYLEAKTLLYAPQNAEYASVVHCLAILYRETKKNKLALPLAMEALSIRKNILKNEHRDYILSLNILGVLFYEIGSYKTAEPFFLEARSIYKTAKKEEDKFYTDILNNLAALYMEMGRFSEAEPLFIEAIAKRKKIFGKESLIYSLSINNLANLYKQMGRYEDAERLYMEAKSIQVSNSADYASTTNNLANLYMEMGRYEDAERLHIEARSIREKIFTKNHSSYASSLGNLANLYDDMGRYEAAESLQLEALKIRKKVLGKEHSEYASSLSNLANLYIHMGRYGEADMLILESMNIREKIFGKVHPDYAQSLNQLANLYTYIGRNKVAEPLYLDAKIIADSILGKENPEYAGYVGNLALLYHEMKYYNLSKTLFLEEKTIQEKVLGREHPDYAKTLNNLASLYMSMDCYKDAELLYTESKNIREKVVGKKHPHYAASLNNLGFLYSEMGDYKSALPLYLKSNAIWAKTLRKTTPDFITSLNNLANLYWQAGRFESANQYYVEANSLQRNRLVSATHYFTETELAAFSELFTTDLNTFYSFSQKSSLSFPSLACAAYDNALFHKGFLLNNVLRLNNLAHSDSTTLKKFHLLKSYYRRLAAEYDKPVKESTDIKLLEEKAMGIEKELTHMVAGYSEAVQQVSWKEVRDKLHPDEAAIEFVHYKLNTPKPTNRVLYAALLLRPTDTIPQFIPLFEEKQLDTILAYVSKGEDYIREVYRGQVPSGKQGKSLTLYELIWQPLQPFLKDIRQVWYSPSGQLHRIAFAAIEDRTGRPISDRLRLNLVGSTRELISRDDEKRTQIQTALLFGDIAFHAQSAGLHEGIKNGCPTINPGSLQTEILLGISKKRTRAALDSLPLTPQPETRVEIQSAAWQFRRLGLEPVIVTDSVATEEAFKCYTTHGQPSPDVIVIASHGGVQPDPQNDTTAYDDYRARKDPMFRSWLAFAGADKYRVTGSGYDSLENGLLTAYEVTGLNLSNTKLAVLSACESGLGKISGAEGVYGLQRAFKIAGAEYLLISLWKIPSSATTELMSAFYEHWLNEKMPVREAFYQAQKDLKAAGKSAYEWAGFVLI